MAGGYTPPLALLVVAPLPEPGSADGRALAAPGVSVTRCETLAEAQALLAAAAFDAVCVAPTAAEADERTLAALATQGGRSVPVFVLGDEAPPGVALLPAAATADDLRHALASGAPEEGADGPATEAEAGAALWALLDALRREVGRVIHAANNPLTVIGGNAQFLLELARAGAFDPETARALEDIEAAGRQLQGELAALAAVRQRLATALASDDALT